MTNAERLALADFGRAEKLFESRKNPKPEKCCSKPQTPKNPLHAVLGGGIFSLNHPFQELYNKIWHPHIPSWYYVDKRQKPRQCYSYDGA